MPGNGAEGRCSAAGNGAESQVMYRRRWQAAILQEGKRCSDEQA